MRLTPCKIFMMLAVPAAALLGQTTEIPKRTLFDSNGQTAPKLVRPTVAPPPDAAKPAAIADNSRGVSPRTMDALNSSNEDLNLIRDRNIRALTAGGCAPEASARIADLVTRLQASGVSLQGSSFSADALRAPGAARPGSESAVLALASDWYKRTGDSTSAASGKDQKEALLDSVLPGTKLSADSEQNVAGMRTELERLLAVCSASKR